MDCDDESILDDALMDKSIKTITNIMLFNEANCNTDVLYIVYSVLHVQILNDFSIGLSLSLIDDCVCRAFARCKAIISTALA